MAEEFEGASDWAACSRAVQRRRKVIDAANTLFRQKGFHAAGIAELAKQSGIAVGQVYRDFASKEEIILEVVEAHCALLIDELALDHAVVSRDKKYISRWISNVLCGRTDLLDAGLLVEIIAESARNDRVLRAVIEKRRALHDATCRAIGVFSSDPRKSSRRSSLADMIIAMSFGIWQERAITKDLLCTGLAESFERIVSREIDELTDG